MADEASFISLIVAQARVDQLMKHAVDSSYPGRQMQSMRELTELVKHDEAVQEAARDSHMARSLTALLTSTTDSAVLDAISALLAALSGSGVHTSRFIDFRYPVAGTKHIVKVSECALKEGVGSRLWGISHTFNLFLMDKPAALINGASVLEIGSGVGSTGVVAAQLGAREVTVTDLTEPLLANLLRTMCANFPSQHKSTNAPVDPMGSMQRTDVDCGALAFSDADSVSDEAELLACDEALNDYLDGGRDPLSNEDCDLRSAHHNVRPTERWDIGCVRVRALDWKLEWDRYVALRGDPVPHGKVNARCADSASVFTDEDETTSALDGLKIDGVSTAAVGFSQDSAGEVNGDCEEERDTFDRPCAPSNAHAMPPAVHPGSTFDVVLGCEVLYETPHAKWVAATIKSRMKDSGHAWIAGAVRDSKVYDAFDHYLAAVDLRHDWQQIHPAPGYGGLGNKEATYEGGYRLYSITHKPELL